MSLLEQPSPTTAKERYLVELNQLIAAAEVQERRLTQNNNEVAAALRVQAMVEARHDAALEVEAERTAIAAEREQIKNDRAELQREKTAFENERAEFRSTKEDRFAKSMAAAHEAARNALNAP